jgi:sugar (pentulose or hexulose) kinase
MPEPQPLPEPELVTVTVDKADATLLLMRDVDGNAWLVPGYAMQQPEGWWSATVSLIEGVIELPAPFEGDITPYRED